MQKNAEWVYRRLARMAILPLLVGLFLLPSCGGGGEPAARQEKVDLEQLDPSGQEVVFWYQHTREREDELLEMIDDFNRTNPHGISVLRDESGGFFG